MENCGQTGFVGTVALGRGRLVAGCTRCDSTVARCAMGRRTRRSVLSGVGAALVAAAVGGQVKAERSLGSALVGIVRVRDGVAELEEGRGSGDVLRVVKLLIRGTDLKADAADAARWLDDEAKAGGVVDSAKEAREMLDLAVGYFDSRGRPSTSQLKFAGQALTAAREALDSALAAFDPVQVKSAREALSAPAF